jgi:UDP-N-acetylglucosamine--N-acetylmuramyl-(pentapeptide) pyrophosphoryl-undecaprenol N-acetylglucosamine transferase
MKKNKILIITGGTGGHVIPAINFFNYLKSNSNNVFLVTDNRGYQYISSTYKKNILKIQSSHLTGNISFKLLGLIKLFIGFWQSLILYIKLRPKTIVSFGSYASFAPLICFVFLRYFFKTKLYLHEQNSLIGQTNKLFSKQANKIFVNFDKEYPSLKKYKNKIFVVGLPQKKINENLNYIQNKNNININFLIFAGSQGSLDILNYFSKLINDIKKLSNLKKINFIVQCPTQMQHKIKNLLTNNNFNFEIKSFFNNFEDILSKTNIALCRSGAGTINDLINYKIPAIILPLPSSKNNHQFENAKILSDIGCAILADRDSKELDKILLFIRNVIDNKSFNNSLFDKYNKIKRYNTNLLMWNHIQDDQ